MERCPSTFALDDRELHGAPSVGAAANDDLIGRHVAACARCATRGATRAALAQRFQEQLAEPLWRRVAAATPRRPRWWRIAWLAPALAIAAIVVVLRPAAPLPPYLATKGEAGVELAGRRAGQVFAFGAGIEALPGDELQLTVRAARPDDAYVLVGSVDGTGAFSPFYPAALDGRSVPLPRAAEPLGPSIVLDAAAGPERIVVVRSARPVSVRAVAPLAQAAAPRKERFAIPGHPDASVRWFVVPKRLLPRSP